MTDIITSAQPHESEWVVDMILTSGIRLLPSNITMGLGGMSGLEQEVCSSQVRLIRWFKRGGHVKVRYVPAR